MSNYGSISKIFATLCLALGVLLYVAGQHSSAETRQRVDFDHLKTGFPLSGAHAREKCESCHVQGIFKGTPTQCVMCHSQGSRTATTAKPADHMQTAEPCENCHTSTTTWTGARFRHMGIAPGTCQTCHNGTSASGKNPGHIQTTAACDSCHRTTAWVPASFNHANVAPGTCLTCHNGTSATGKNPGHIQTTAACDTCHRTTAWIPATFSHANVAPGTCLTCHNGTSATGKNPGHIQTTAACDTCHRTTAWIPATFSHTGVTPGTCSTCHNGTSASGKPSGHFVTTRSCDACHTTSAWTPTLRYSHTSPYYSTHNSGVQCTGCHTSNNEVIAWKFSAYKPDCAGCHADRFKADSHKKTEVPTKILYTVSELRNCTGSCHQYTNNTFTTILKSRNSEHRSTDGGF